MENWSLQKIILTVGALAMVAGASFLISSAGTEPEILQRPPEVVENIDPGKDPFKGAGGDQTQGISVVPTEIVTKNAFVGLKLPAIIVRNGSLTKQSFKTSFVQVSRFLPQGGAVISDDPDDIKKGEGLVRLNKKRFTLRPGESESIIGEVVGGDNEKMLVGSINIDLENNEKVLNLPEEKGADPKIVSKLRISSMVYAIFDRQDSEKVSLKGISAREYVGPGGENLRFFATVRSDNDFLSIPKGVVTVRDQSGQVEKTVSFLGDQNVLPRQEREISTEGLKLDPGSYEIEARVISGDSGQSIKRPLEIASDGAPIDVKAEAILKTEVVRVLPGGSFASQLQLLNSGNQAFSPKGKISVYKEGSNLSIDERELNINPVRPDDVGTEDFIFKAPNQKGDYSIVADIYDEQGKFLTQASADMVVTETNIIEKSDTDEIRDWLSDNPLRSIAVGIFAFGIIAVIIIGLIYLISKINYRKK